MNEKVDRIMQEHITLGAGCFWGVQSTFDALDGVISTEVGYAGGDNSGVNYQQVCTGKTDHAEVVKVTFDPNRISLYQILAVFWQCHDPSSIDRQGPDVGSQYRSCLFYSDEAQLEKIEKSKLAAIDSGYWTQIVTQIAPIKNYTKAEEYHQHYHAKQKK